MPQGLWDGTQRALVHSVQVEEGVHSIWREQLRVLGCARAGALDSADVSADI